MWQNYRVGAAILMGFVAYGWWVTREVFAWLEGQPELEADDALLERPSLST